MFKYGRVQTTAKQQLPVLEPAERRVSSQCSTVDIHLYVPGHISELCRFPPKPGHISE